MDDALTALAAHRFMNNRRRMQMGIVVGFLLNVLFGVWTYLLSSS